MRGTRTIAWAAAWLAWGAMAAAQDPQQVDVAVKVVEFQTNRGLETGFSAYFKRRLEPQPYGRLATTQGIVQSLDYTFPSTTTSGISVFFDNISAAYGDIEVVLQGLEDENRATILSRPKVKVPVGAAAPTIIKTTQGIPYESTIVVGATAVQTTAFRDTGVTLEVSAQQVIDDDGDPGTMDDVYILLQLRAEVNEEGPRITVALDDRVTAAQGSNALSVPEFVSRSINTTVWVRHGQVLVLGGLYRNSTNKSLDTMPWLSQGEDLLAGALQRIVPFGAPQIPLSAGFGNQRKDEGRRELVFLIKAEIWQPTFTVADDFGFLEEPRDTTRRRLSPTDVITGVLGEIADVPRGIATGVAGRGVGDDITQSLGKDDE